MLRCADRESGVEARVRRSLGEVLFGAAVSLYVQSRLTIRTREGGFRGVASIVRSRTIDGRTRCSRAAGKGVFHEFDTAAVWPFRSSARRQLALQARDPREPAGAPRPEFPTYLSPWIPSDLLVTNPITIRSESSSSPRRRSTPTIPTARASATKARSSRASIGRATSG